LREKGPLLTTKNAIWSRPVSALTGGVSVPGDKSITHRALIFGLLTIGTTKIHGALDADDTRATADVIGKLGASVNDDLSEVRGVGVGGLIEPQGALDFGNSGTGARLIMGLVASHAVTAEFTGDPSLMSRPMNRVLKPLADIGATWRDGADGRLPLTLTGAHDPLPITYELPVPSAQVKSAVLLAGLNCPGVTTVIESLRSRDHTERMLKHFGADITVADDAGKRIIKLKGYPKLKPRRIDVPGDPSSAAFAIVAGLITPNADIRVKRVLLNPTRRGLLDTLLEMGARIDILNRNSAGGEPVGDLRVRTSALKGVEVPAERAPAMIDEYPILAIAASFAEGPTHMAGIGELRVKESDRLDAVAHGLDLCGVAHEAGQDFLTVLPNGAMPGGAMVESRLDHRIAMSFLIAGMAAQQPVGIDDQRMIATSFPSFIEHFGVMGADFRDDKS
jgi:3-phosphoshikimate 1-carboxyvinyltransferase